MRNISRRNSYMDFVKLTLIILVIIGHALQFFKYGSANFWNNYLFKAIYTFHMPLFMTISGYYAFYSTKNKKFSVFVLSKIKYILIPLISWGIISSSFRTICLDLSIIERIIIFAHYTTSQFWFVWAVFIFSFIIYILNKLKIDKLPVLILLGILINFLPTSIRFRFDIGKAFFIYYVIAYWFASVDNKSIYINWARRLFLLLVFLSVLFFFVWKPENETTDLYQFHFWSEYIIRISGGILTSITILFVLHYIFSKIQDSAITRKAVFYGQNTLALYFIQDSVIIVYINFFMKCYTYPQASDVAVVFFALLFSLLCFFTIKQTSKNQLLAFMLLGKKFRRIK